MATAGILLKGSTMLELGDQMMGKNLPAKEYFTGLGVKHTSIDWNKRHGALKLDLAEPLGLSEYDVVTNFGTAEHVSNQRTLFCNIHRACRPGGVIVHKGPIWSPRNRRHGIPKYGFCIRYSPKFFGEMAEDNGYEVTTMEEDGWLIRVGFICPEKKGLFEWRH